MSHFSSLFFRALLMMGGAIVVTAELSSFLPVLSQLPPQEPTPGSTQGETQSPMVTPPRIKLQDAWQQVYRRLPNFPLENNYIDIQTKRVVQDNTLAGRLIRYHIYTKGRPATSRLDWKLTLADYLGVNEFLQTDDYPSATALTINPIQGDTNVIRALTLLERNVLIKTLVAVFTPPSTSQTGIRPTTPLSSPVLLPVQPILPPVKPTNRQPKAADLLVQP